MADNARKTGSAVEAHFQFLMWLVPAIKKQHAARVLDHAMAFTRADGPALLDAATAPGGEP
jgi:hypothetical protein